MRNRRQSGYSLPEMLTVIAIVGTLALVSVPAFLTYMQSNKMKSTLRNFTTDIRRVRQLAITRGHQTLLTYDVTATGAAQADYKRTYAFYEGNLPFNSTTWTAAVIPGQTTAQPKTLADVVYFPANTASTPQTFPDVLTCTGTSCSAGTDTKLDIIFYPDGRVLMPTGSTVADVTLATDMRIPTKTYTVEITPTGRVLAR